MEECSSGRDNLVMIEGAGHMVILERHDEVNRSLRDLLARASGPSPR